MIELALKYAIRNKKFLESSPKSGCFKCLRIFETKEIKMFTDQGETAICPYCNNDTVIPSALAEPNLEFLSKVKNYWF